MLNSKLGFDVACNFPARYTFLKNKKYEIPNYNLKKCEELSTYIDSFSKDSLNLVFSSEYTNNPSSAFGHIMLLFSNDNKSMEEGDVIHFAAKTPRTDGFFKYSYNGLTGKYNGYFIREPFFKKLYEYNTLEQRYLHVYKLNYTKKEIEFLIYHLYELRKATFKYYFFDANCASQISDLISIIDKKNLKNDSNFYLPIYTLADYENRITDVKAYMPTVNKINYLIKKMNNKEKKDFFENVKTSNKVDDNYSDLTKEALQLNTILKFRKFNIVDKNYENIMSQTFNPTKIVDKNPDPLSKTKPSLIELGFINSNNNYYSLKYRPLFIELNDFQNETLQKSEINTFTWEALISDKNIKLNNFNIINIKSLPKQLDFYNPISWNIYLGLNRNNYKNNLKLNTEAGFGRTLNIIDNLHSSIIFNLGSDENEVYIKPYLYLDYEFNSSYKVSFHSEYKSYLNDEYFYKHNLIFTKKFNDKYFNFEVSDLSSFDEFNYKVSLKLNF